MPMEELNPGPVCRFFLRDMFRMSSGHRSEFIRVMLRQVYFTFVQTIPMISGPGFFCGMLISFQASWGLSLLGDATKTGELLVYLIFREITPAAILLLIIARSVTAVASEIATMKVSSQIDALAILGVDVRAYLWGPRILAGAIAIFCMAVVFWFSATIGAWFGAGMPALVEFIMPLITAIAPEDVLFFCLKTLPSGAIVFWLACRRGAAVGHSGHEVPVATNSAVVDALLWAFLYQLGLSVLFYLMVGF